MARSHDWFVEKARDCFAEAGESWRDADPEPLACWAEQAKRFHRDHGGVMVDTSGRIVAVVMQRNIYGEHLPAGYIESCPDHPDLVGLVADIARSRLSVRLGRGVAWISYWDAATGNTRAFWTQQATLEALARARDRAQKDVAETTEELRESCLAAVTAGVEKQKVAERAGISRVTLDRWLSR